MIQAAQQIDAPRRVLIIKPSALGDVVTALPVLRGLRRSFPRAHISWLVSDTCAPLISHDSQLDEVIIFHRKKLGRAWRSVSAAAELGKLLLGMRMGRFDWVIDLQGLLRSGLLIAATRAPLRAGFADASEGAWVFYTKRSCPRPIHTVERNIALARRLGIDARPADMTLEVSPGGREFAETFCGDYALAAGQYVLCVPPTTWPSKLYPVRHWRKVITELSRRLPVVLIGAPGDRQLCRQVAQVAGSGVIDLSGQTTVEQMVGVIACSGGVVCCDSAAKFVASAVGVGCVTLIGPTRAERTGPYPTGRAIVAEISCQGCLKRKCYHITCMQTIGPGDVISAAGQMLDARKI